VNEPVHEVFHVHYGTVEAQGRFEQLPVPKSVILMGMCSSVARAAGRALAVQEGTLWLLHRLL
jgi:hypothetical protein